MINNTLFLFLQIIITQSIIIIIFYIIYFLKKKKFENFECSLFLYIFYIKI